MFTPYGVESPPYFTILLRKAGNIKPVTPSEEPQKPFSKKIPGETLIKNPVVNYVAAFFNPPREYDFLL